MKSVLLPVGANNISTLYIGFLFTSGWGNNCSLDYVKVTGQISGGICPTGWHVPSDAEYTILTTYLGGESVAGGKLKETGYVHWVSPNTGATNSSGFTALPGGSRLVTGLYGNLLTDANFWTSTVSSTTSWRRNLLYSGAIVTRTAENKLLGYSLRCIGEFSPTLTTVSPSNVLRFSAASGGNVTSDGSAIVTARGVCWNTSMNPTIAGNHSMDGIGTGSFTSAITGLSTNTTYFIRAYATNTAGTSYGNEFSFTTLSPLAPVVTTAAVTNITHGTASSGGNVSDDGGATVLARGVCWSKASNPSLTNSHKIGRAHV